MGAVIGVASSAAIGTTCGAVVRIASGIGGAASRIGKSSYRDSCGGYYWACCWWVEMSFTDLACCAGYLGVVGVKGDVLALK